jgi:hypothetical protein
LQAQWVPENILSSNAATNTKSSMWTHECTSTNHSCLYFRNLNSYLQTSRKSPRTWTYFLWEVKAQRKEPSHRREGASFTCLFTLIHFTLEISTWELYQAYKTVAKEAPRSINHFLQYEISCHKVQGSYSVPKSCGTAITSSWSKF